MEFSEKGVFSESIPVENAEIETSQQVDEYEACLPNKEHIADTFPVTDICNSNTEKKLLKDTEKADQDACIREKDKEFQHSKDAFRESEILAQVSVSKKPEECKSFENPGKVSEILNPAEIECNNTEILVKEIKEENPFVSAADGKNQKCKNSGITLKESTAIPHASISTKGGCKSPVKESKLNYDLNNRDNLLYKKLNGEKEVLADDVKSHTVEKDVDECKQGEMVSIRNEISSDIENRKTRILSENTVLEEAVKSELSVCDEKKAIASPPEVLSMPSLRKLKENDDYETGTKLKEHNIHEVTLPGIKADSTGSIKEEKLDIEVENALELTDKLEKDEKKDIYIVNDFSYLYDMPTPLICKKVITDNNTKSFNARYDLAIEKNKRRFRIMKQQGLLTNCVTIEDRKREACKPEEEKRRDAQRRKFDDSVLALRITKISVRILQNLQSKSPNQGVIAKLLMQFLFIPATSTSLLYVPHFVRMVAFCRGNKKFARPLRSLADDCYQKCHVMFPIPLGCNFETVYMSEVRKFAPSDLDRIEDISFEYGDLSDKSDGSDREENLQD